MINLFTDKKEWRPTRKQSQAITVPDSVLEVFFGGAAGGGKSELGIVYPLVKKCKFSDRMWYQHPKFKGVVLRRTIPEVKKELIRRSEEYYPQTGAVLNQTDRVWKWSWGAQLYLAAAEHEEDIRRFDTEQFNYVFFEELTSFSEFMYIYMMSRCRPADEDLPSRIFSASTPGNVGHGWVRKRFVEPYKEGGKIIRQFFFNKDGTYIEDESGKPKFIERIYVRALPTDNPHLMKNDPDYLSKLEALPLAERMAKLGDWWTFSGQVFDSFRDKKFPDEPENALHVIDPVEIPIWWPRILSIDWGFNAATVGYWAAISPEGRIYIYREYYVLQTDVAVWGTEIGELSIGENIRALVLDTNAWDSRGEPETIAQQFQRHFNTSFGSNHLQAEPASKGRVSGKILIQEYLRWKPKPAIKKDSGIIYDQEEAEKLRRISEVAWQRYVELFAPPKIEDNIPRLQIFSSCKRLIECIPLCVYDKEPNQEDVAQWQVNGDMVGDDPYDNLRYLLKRCDRYVREAKSEFDVREREQKVVQYFAATNDITGYYRKMENLERGAHKRKAARRASWRQKYAYH